MSIHPDDTYDGGRLVPNVTTWRNGHHRECCCYLCDPDDLQPDITPCPCGDSYCSDFMPKNQDRSACCQYCGPYDCDVCGWTDPTHTTPESEAHR